jgi:hypothetical protein
MSWIPRGAEFVGTNIPDYYGGSIALSSDGSVVAIGCVLRNSFGGNVGGGYVRIYAWNGTSWTQRGSDLVGEGGHKSFGYSIALNSSGSVLLVGAPFYNNYGKVYAYTWNGSSWTSKGSISNSTYYDGRLGASVAITPDGDTIAVAAPIANTVGGSSGYVSIYTWNGSSWQIKGSQLNGLTASESFGISISLTSNGSIIAIGSDLYKPGSTYDGCARIYEYNGSSWVQRGSTLTGSSTNERRGFSISLSQDGSKLAIGALNSSKVYTYTWSSGNWQSYSVISGGTEFGFSVALSRDGNYISIGNRLSLLSIYNWSDLSTPLQTISGNNDGMCIGISDDGQVIASGEGTSYGTGSAIVYNYKPRPTAPRNIFARAGNAKGFIFWDTPLSDGGTPITSYTITSSPGNLTTTVGGSLQSGTVSGLTNGTAYTFTVTATTAAGTSNLSTTSSSITPVDTVVPCFFGSARVLTPGGYRRLDSVAAGDVVLTPDGSRAAIQYVRTYTIDAGPATNPYVIPAGTYGAKRRLLISPDHKVCLDDGRRVAARDLGLDQEERDGVLRYFNLELEGGADMVIDGVAVESLQYTHRVRMTVQELSAMLRETYGTITPAVLARVQRTCRFLEDGMVEVPVTPPKPQASISHNR